jgi:hypothetical protein
VKRKNDENYCCRLCLDFICFCLRSFFVGLLQSLGLIMNWPTYKEMKEKQGIWACPFCEGTDKWCILELDDERGAVCERHGVIVPNLENKGE